MKIKLHYLGALLLCLALLCGCVNLYLYVQPQPNEEERWVAEELEMYFEWMEEEGFVGEMPIDGEVTAIEVYFDYGTGAEFFPFEPELDVVISSHRLFSADCKFGKDKLVMTVERDDADLFNGDLPTITFIRQELQEDGTFAVPE